MGKRKYRGRKSIGERFPKAERPSVERGVENSTVVEKSGEVGESRRAFLKKMGIVLGLVGVGAGVGSLLLGEDADLEKGKPIKKTSTVEVNSTDKLNYLQVESRADHKILAVEAGFKRFKEKYLPLIETLDDEVMKIMIKEAFRLFDHNTKVNEERNVLKLARNRGHGTDDYSIGVYTAQFFYQFKKMSYDRTAASFSATSRKMTLADDFNPDHDVDNLVLLHELIHVYNDSLLRMNLKTEQQWRSYKSFYTYEVGGRPKFNLYDEATAIACELEVLDLMLDGALSSAVKNGVALDKSAIFEKLDMPDLSQVGPLSFLLMVAMSYFAGKDKVGKYPKPFLDQIAAKAKEHGYLVYMPDEKGDLMPY